MDAPARIGAYTLERELGRGAMGVVYRATHGPTGSPRALKLISGAADPELLERFRREAAALARVGGDSVVPVHELGVERGRIFFVMGLMSGGTLRERLASRGKLPWREAATLGAALAKGLARCHAAGLVHRDLKPDNVLFDDEGRPRIADFGCVRDLGAAALTVSGSLVGTPVYSAPEQLAGQRAGPAADVFGLGVILHELVAGALPFPTSPSIVLLYEDRKAGKRTPLPSLDASIPAAFEGLVARALAPDPGARPAAAELATALEALASAAQPGAAARKTATVPTRKPGAGRPRALLALLLAGGVLASLALVAVAFAVRRGPGRGTQSGGQTASPSPAPTSSARPSEPPAPISTWTKTARAQVIAAAAHGDPTSYERCAPEDRAQVSAALRGWLAAQAGAVHEHLPKLTQDELKNRLEALAAAWRPLLVEGTPPPGEVMNLASNFPELVVHFSEDKGPEECTCLLELAVAIPEEKLVSLTGNVLGKVRSANPLSRRRALLARLAAAYPRSSLIGSSRATWLLASEDGVAAEHELGVRVLGEACDLARPEDDTIWASCLTIEYLLNRSGLEQDEAEALLERLRARGTAHYAFHNEAMMVRVRGWDFDLALDEAETAARCQDAEADPASKQLDTLRYIYQVRLLASGLPDKSPWYHVARGRDLGPPRAGLALLGVRGLVQERKPGWLEHARRILARLGDVGAGPVARAVAELRAKVALVKDEPKDRAASEDTFAQETLRLLDALPPP